MNIYVGNLAPDVTEDDLKHAFEPYGAVASVSIVKDRFTGEPRGFGFLEMPSKVEALQAINNLNYKELKGQLMKVNEARPKEERRGSRGGRPGGGGGGGNRFRGR
jgi:RNA recognition motif-containing protein